MADPVTLTVGAIAALALTKYLESTIEQVAEKLNPAMLEKMNALRQEIPTAGFECWKIWPFVSTFCYSANPCSTPAPTP